MRRFVTLLLLVWNGLFQNVVEPLVQQAEAVLVRATEDAEALDERWEELGVPDAVVEPVDAISDVSELTLGLPQEMLEEADLILGADGEARFRVVEGMLQQVAVPAGNEVLIPSVIGGKVRDEEGDSCSTRMMIANGDPWGDSDDFYVTLRLIGPDDEQVGRRTERLSADRLPVWIIDLAELERVQAEDPPEPWCGNVTITAHDRPDDARKPSPRHRVRVDVLTLCHCNGTEGGNTE
jgi:hypothetical protein